MLPVFLRIRRYLVTDATSPLLRFPRSNVLRGKLLKCNSVDLTLIIAVCNFWCSFDAKCFVFV